MKKSQVFTILLGVICLLGTTFGVAIAMGERPATGDTKSVSSKKIGRTCFNADHVRSFESADFNRLIIITYDNEAYSLELGAGCMSVDATMGIVITGRFGMSQICGAFDGNVHFNDMGRQQTCPITSVKRLEGEDSAKYVTPSKKKKNEP